MDWEVVKIAPKTKGRSIPFVSVGNGKIEFSAAACNLIENCKGYQYVQLLKAKDKGEPVIGVKFLYEYTDHAIALNTKSINGKEINNRYISSKAVVEDLFGINGTDNKVTNYHVERDKEAKDILIIREKFSK